MPQAPKPQSERSCLIKATTLEDIRDTCLRHIRNANLTQIDLMEEQDGTPADYAALDYLRGTWRDMLQDVEEMIAARDEPEKHPVCHAYVVEVMKIVRPISHSQGFKSTQGFLVFKDEVSALQAIEAKAGTYHSYKPIGKIGCSFKFYERLRTVPSDNYLLITKLGELEK